MNNNASPPSDKAITARTSLNLALHSLMEEDPRVVIAGEDILDPYGGAFKVTQGLSTRFPDRVFTTPISEATIVGMANGLALRGYRPIVEVMFGDFLTLAADQLINHAAKFRQMYNEALHVPLVVRAPMGGRRGYGPTHSQSLEKHFLGVPGLWVVSPHIYGNPGNLLRKATLECHDPVIFIESKACYGRYIQENITGFIVESFSDLESPFPTTYLKHNPVSSVDGLLFCYGGMAPVCLEAINLLKEKEGLTIDLAVLTQLSPIPVTHLNHFVDKVDEKDKKIPGICIYAEENNSLAGWSAEMLAQMEELASRQNNGEKIKHLRIGALPSVISCSRELEAKVLPQVHDITNKVLNFF